MVAIAVCFFHAILTLLPRFEPRLVILFMHKLKIVLDNG